MKKLRSIGLLLILVLLVSSMISAKSIYPLKSDVTLTWWMELHSNVSQVVKNFGDTEFAKELQKRTGVKIKFIHPASGSRAQVNEAFNLMLASGDLPDIIEYYWYDMPGGPNEAIKNGYIHKLNSIIDKYAPNLKAYLKKHPEYDKMVKTDEGSYYVFPFLRADPALVSTAGPIIRKDWLDELGLQVPTTYDEWYTVLKAFKEKKGATVPLSIRYDNLNAMLAGGADNTGDFYQENGKVKYGPMEPSRKKFLETMNKWYKEGLLDNNFATNTSKIIDANILTGKAGATYGSGGSGIGRYMAAMEKDPKFKLTGAPYPSPRKGQKARFANRSQYYGPNSNGSAAISTKCKNVELAARVLDYAYSPEGHRFYNFGIEGVSYTMKNGKPIYTPLITNNPQGLAMTQAMSHYMRSHCNGPFVQDKGYIEQYYNLPEQQEAAKVWPDNDWGKYMLPPITPTPEESRELSRIMNDVNTYVQEMTMKFIMGVESLDKFDDYVAQLKKMGIERAIAINQAALERYKKR